MASGNYNLYNYPYQQSSAQQYSAYQTAPAANKAPQPSRQYQQPTNNQANEYMPYQGQSYGGQGMGYAGQDSSWGSNNYGATQATTSRAAEVLRNMSNNSYTPHSTSVSQPVFTATSAGNGQFARYASDKTHSPQLQPLQTHGAHLQSQSRPRSVNTNRAQVAASRGLPSPATAAGYPVQRTQTLYNQQQRSASPAHPQYSNSSSTTHVSTARDATMTATSQQYADYDRRQLASVDNTRSNQHAAPLSTYNYSTSQTVAPPGPIAPPPSSNPEPYLGQGSTTVDPTAVYDPWPEYQRKAEALRAQKAIEDAARAEEERLAEEKRKAEEVKKQEAARAQALANQPKSKSNNTPNQSAAGGGSAEPEASGPVENALESEIRAMMAKMRELNSKDPALLARIWEEERRAKASPKSPTVQAKTTPQPAPAPAPSAQGSAPKAANQKKKATPKETTKPNAAKPPKPATPAPAPVSAPAPAPTPAAVPVARPQPQAVSHRPGGNTIWPPEKKAQLAAAAATYLNTHNPNNQVRADRVLSMLDGNPSYIELCEQLEQMGLKLDRAAFAKNLLSAVPDVNSSGRKAAPQPAPAPVQKPMVPPAVLKREVATPGPSSAAISPHGPTPSYTSPYQTFPKNAPPAPQAPVAEMIPIKAELKPPANKEEAARKRNLSDLVDLTLLDDEEDMGPPPKKPNTGTSYSDSPHVDHDMAMEFKPTVNGFEGSGFEGSGNGPSHQVQEPPLPPSFYKQTVVEPLDKKKALRRNTYNPATIARDILLASGRHPNERQLNQHLDALKANIPHVGYDSDLSTLNWNLLDPGRPPPGYFRDSMQAVTEDADDEDESDEEDSKTRPRQSSAISGGSGAQGRVQALPEAVNPFKAHKQRGRPRQSLPNDATPTTPSRASSVTTTKMTSSAPRESTGTVGYRAFREYGPDGQPLPKKRGRPVGWRKAIHGSPAALAKPNSKRATGPPKHQPSQPTPLRGTNEPIRVDSRSPSVANRPRQYQSFKCKWKHCPAELHNLETLKKHVFKVHCTMVDSLIECQWADCRRDILQWDHATSSIMDVPYKFESEGKWQGHIQEKHLDPLSWQLGDGPASGLSDSHDSEAYLSDAQGRRVTPRIRVDPEVIESLTNPWQAAHVSSGRGRPPKNKQEQEARDGQDRLISQKRRMGGPGMDRGGATLVNDKRRRGFIDSDEMEEELVDVED